MFKSVKLSELKPGTLNDFKPSESEGPLVVMRHPDGQLIVEDGNHEYFERVRTQAMQGLAPDVEVEIVEVPYVPYKMRDEAGVYLGRYRRRVGSSRER